ncbi:MAG: porin family protein [Bacteroidales bacterium]
MKKLSKVLFVLLLVVISAQTYAQKFGIQAGLNLSNQVWKDDDDTYSDEFKMLPGFNAGVTFEMGFGDLIGLEVGLIADTKGFKIKEDVLGSEVTMKASLLYLDVPVLIKVGPSFGPAKVFAAAGPYVGFGLTGKMKMEAEGEEETEDISWGSDEVEDDFKRLDFGAKFGIGAEVMNFTLGAYYSLGLANLSPYTDGGARISNNLISISVGYKF